MVVALLLDEYLRFSEPTGVLHLTQSTLSVLAKTAHIFPMCRYTGQDRATIRFNWPTVMVVAAVIVIISACGKGARNSVDADEAVRLRVMTFNIEWGGANISFEKVVEAIRVSQADIVGIQEPVGNLLRLADELGWYHDESTYVISKFPLLSAPRADGRYLFIEIERGKVVAMANVHLPSDPDGMALVRDGASADEVLAIERATRLPTIVPYLDSLKPLIDANFPVFLTGDFNAPSHADWTEETVGLRPFVRYPLRWPVSQAITGAGFKDAWRESYPDPVKHPGLTWWARRPPLASYSPGENDAEERIDFIWFAGSMEVLTSQIVGEERVPGVSITVDPWPSDHRGVVSQFAVTPATTPALVTTAERVYHTGDVIEVLFRRAEAVRIQIWEFGTSGAPAFDSGYRVTGDGKLDIAPNLLPAGHYSVSMATSDTDSIRYDFWVLDRDARPEVEVDGQLFDVGDSIGFAWENAPGFRNDYLSVVEDGAISDYDGGITWLYIDSQPSGHLQLDASTSELSWPLPPGRYVLRLLQDDGDEVLAESSSFTVR